MSTSRDVFYRGVLVVTVVVRGDDASWVAVGEADDATSVLSVSYRAGVEPDEDGRVVITGDVCVLHVEVVYPGVWRG